VEMIGREIGGRYRLTAPLGEGGMATLWRALDQQLDREVAVKILRPQYSADPGFAARFKQEARSAASLSHPNIVSVYDYGTDPDGETQYIVMELVEGRDLASVLRERGRISIEDAVQVAIATASALEAAHRRGIVHRDVKPGNILITEEGDVKVTDFGIARAVSEASMTVTGTTLGSVHYFSPEQARGDEVTGRSDVYALGIVLYEMITGRRPFEGDSAAGVALKRLTDPPPRPMVAGQPLPPGLEAILRRALEREPAQRFPDAGSFAEALREWQRDPDAVPAGLAAARAGAAGPPAGEPTVYVPPPVARPSDRAPYAGPPRQQAQPVRQEGQPWWIWLLAVLAVLLLGVIGFLGAQILTALGPAASPTPSAPMVTIPTDWVGMKVIPVQTEATRLGLKTTVERKNDNTIPVDQVISTDPTGGTPVPEGSTVKLTVSAGQEMVAVPALVGQTRNEAAATLTGVGLQLGSVGQAFSADQPQGAVISSNPAAGVSVPKGSQVNVVLSRGPEPTPTPTPTPVPTPIPTPVPTPTPTPTPTP
jgi:hypothetical protein